MSILGRLSTLIKSNVNDAIDSMQDPGKEIDQMVLDMEDSTRQAKAEVAGCMAEEKRMAKQVQTLLDDAQVWTDRAGDAVRAGDDPLAREALRRKAEIDANRLEIEKALDDQKVYVDQLMAGLKAFEKTHPALAKKIQPIFITVDPQRDTPAVLQSYARQHGILDGA